jgi:medium-chain acyl-[acyl-carrier-protein] hydrolase
MRNPSAWLRCSDVNPRPAVRLICFPHAGGGASSFNGWRSLLPEWIGLVKAQLPGREDRRECNPLTRIEDVIPSLFPPVRELLDRPVAFYGHSMGALIAFELACELRRKGQAPPVAVLISGRRAPHKPLRSSYAMHNLPDHELAERLLRLGGIPPALLENQRWRDHYLSLIRADLCISDEYTYSPEPALAFPLHAFLGRHDNLVVREDWEAWSDVAEGEFSRQLLPSGHFFDKAATSTLIVRLTEVIAGALGLDAVSEPAQARSAK